MKTLASLLLLMASLGLGGAALAQEDDGWFGDDEEYTEDYEYNDTNEYDDTYGDGYEYDAQDNYGYYDDEYEYQAEDEWFNDWYGNADEDWDWF